MHVKIKEFSNLSLPNTYYFIFELWFYLKTNSNRQPLWLGFELVAGKFYTLFYLKMFALYLVAAVPQLRWTLELALLGCPPVSSPRLAPPCLASPGVIKSCRFMGLKAKQCHCHLTHTHTPTHTSITPTQLHWERPKKLIYYLCLDFIQHSSWWHLSKWH